MPAATTSAKMGVASLVLSAGPVVKLVLFILFVLSVICWGIILFKHISIKRARKESDSFLRIFWDARRLDEVSAAVRDHESSPAARVFRAGYSELMKAVRETKDDNIAFSARSIDMIDRALRGADGFEISSLQRNLNFLATTGSAAPFIGLFGTVWGIMNSFQRIGEMGTANLAVVAPGVSEALIATALGLAAAIPAVVFYNIFVERISKLSGELDGMILEFLNIAERGLRRQKSERS